MQKRDGKTGRFLPGGSTPPSLRKPTVQERFRKAEQDALTVLYLDRAAKEHRDAAAKRARSAAYNQALIDLRIRFENENAQLLSQAHRLRTDAYLHREASKLADLAADRARERVHMEQRAAAKTRAAKAVQKQLRLEGLPGEVLVYVFIAIIIVIVINAALDGIGK